MNVILNVSPRRSLRQRVFNAGVWSLGGYGLGQVLRFGSNLLMTRLLQPEMFGVMSIATVVMVGLAMFSDFGVRQSVIQSKRGNDAAFLNTAWAIQVLRGALIWLLAVCISLVIVEANRLGIIPKGSVYVDSNLPWVIGIWGITAVIAGFESTKLIEASRDLSLGRVTQIEMISQLAGLLFMIGWVLIDRSIWAMVGGGVFSSLVRTVLSHAWQPGNINRWEMDRAAFWEILHFGKWMFLSSILGFLVNNGDRLIISIFVDVGILGVYVIAFSIFGAIEQVMMKIVAELSFPVFSEIVRERPSELKKTYYRFYTIIALCSYFSAGILMTLGQVLIRLLYDERYQQAGWMLQILAVILLTVPFHLSTQSFMALGMPRLLSRIISVRLITLLIATPVGFYCLGLPGALWGIVLSHFSYLPMIVKYNLKYKLFDLRRELLLLPAVGGGLAVGELIHRILNGFA